MISERRKKRLRKRKRNIFIILSILVFATAGYFAVNNQFVRGIYYRSSASVAEENVKIEGDTGVLSDFTVWEDTLYACSKNGLTTYDMAGNQVFLQEDLLVSHALSEYINPVLVPGDGSMLAFDHLGKQLLTFNHKQIIHQLKTEYNIIMAKPIPTGGFLLITEDAGAKNQLIVYDQFARKTFVWHSGVSNILDATYSLDEKRLVVLSIDISEGDVTSSLLFFEVDQTEPYQQYSFSGELVTNLSYYNRSAFLAISDRGLYHFNQKGELLSSYPFKERLLNSYQILDRGMVALSFKKTGPEPAVVEIVNTAGKLRGSFIAQDEILHMDYRNNTILLCQKRRVDIISKSAFLVRSIDYNKDLKKALFIGKNKMVLIGNSDVRIIN